MERLHPTEIWMAIKEIRTDRTVEKDLMISEITESIIEPYRNFDAYRGNQYRYDDTYNDDRFR